MASALVTEPGIRRITGTPPLRDQENIETGDDDVGQLRRDRLYEPDWMDGNFDPFTIWLDADESSPEAGAYTA